MTTQQQEAFINGFVKRAAQYGYNEYEAINILKAAELKGDQHKLDVDKDGKIEGSDLKKLRQRKQAGFLSEGLANMKQMAGDTVNAGKQLVSNLGESYNNYVTAKNTPTPEDLAANQKAHDSYARQMAPQPEHQKLPGTLTGGTLTGGTATSAPALTPMRQVKPTAGGPPAVRLRP
jgi:hypothetical protein